MESKSPPLRNMGPDALPALDGLLSVLVPMKPKPKRSVVAESTSKPQTPPKPQAPSSSAQTKPHGRTPVAPGSRSSESNDALGLDARSAPAPHHASSDFTSLQTAHEATPQTVRFDESKQQTAHEATPQTVRFDERARTARTEDEPSARKVPGFAFAQFH